MTTTDIERTPLHEIAIAPITAQVIYAAAELRIADLLADGPRTAHELAEAAGAHGPSLRRLLMALAGLGIVVHVDDRFELTDAGRPLQSGAPDSQRELIRMLCGPEMLRAWGELVASVRGGVCAWNLAHGMPVFEHYAEHPESAATFNAAMAEHTRDAAPGIVAALDLSGARTVVDVGGGDGTLMAAILRAEPELDGVVFDLPDALGDPAGYRVAPGDFFSAVPEGADAYVLKQILHDWSDEPATRILRSCRTAMHPGARLLIVERLLPEHATEDDLRTLMIDLQMLVATGGRERTEREYGELLAAAGLTLTSVSDVIPPFDYRVVEARRA